MRSPRAKKPGMNPNLSGIAPSIIRAIAAKRTPTSIDLGLGEPTLRPEMRFFDEAGAWVAEHGCPYSFNAGDPELRERIAAHYGYPGMTKAEHVCVTTGSQEALYAVITGLLDPRTDVLTVIEPAFGSYVKIAELAGVTTQSIAMDPANGFAFDVEQIAESLDSRTRMLVICSPCNPTGRVLRRHDAQALADKLSERPGPPVIVVFDEVYRELTYIDDAASFAEFYPHTIAINSLSKSNALTGLRIGWTIAPDTYAPTLVKMHSWMSSAASTFGQRVANAIFREPGALEAHSAWYSRRVGPVTGELERYGFTHAPIEGAFYAFVSVPHMTDSVATAIAIAEEEDVLVIPGRAFGAGSSRWLRLSWVASLENFGEALARIAKRLGIESVA